MPFVESAIGRREGEGGRAWSDGRLTTTSGSFHAHTCRPTVAFCQNRRRFLGLHARDLSWKQSRGLVPKLSAPDARALSLERDAAGAIDSTAGCDDSDGPPTRRRCFLARVIAEKRPRPRSRNRRLRQHHPAPLEGKSAPPVSLLVHPSLAKDLADVKSSRRICRVCHDKEGPPRSGRRCTRACLVSSRRNNSNCSEHWDARQRVCNLSFRGRGGDRTCSAA